MGCFFCYCCRPNASGKLIDDEERETGAVRFAVYKNYLKSTGADYRPRVPISNLQLLFRIRS